MSKLRSYAPVWVKRMVWNHKHQHTSLDPYGFPHDLLGCFSALHVNASVADFGCGAGNLRAALRARGWRGHYLGVDISERAIHEASRSSDANAEWHISPIEDFPGLTEKVDVICFNESIYYIQPRYVPAVLARCRESLADAGRIFIRIWHTERHREHIALLRGSHGTPPIYTFDRVTPS